MATIRILSLFTLAVLTLTLMETRCSGAEALCGGQRYETSVIARGASPYVELMVDGVTGSFLLDYGSTRSSLSAAAFGASEGTTKTATISLPSPKVARFRLVHYDLLLQPGKKQLGVIGGDILSQLTVQLSDGAAFLGDQPRDATASRERGLTPVAQAGFFSANPSSLRPGLPNVPVVFLRLGGVRVWAQLDTGYDDIVHPHSVDINGPLYERLLANGVELDKVAKIKVWTCDGSEDRPVYAPKDAPLTVENDLGTPVVQTTEFRLVLKRPNGCGGIAEMTEPAAQLGASFLHLFGTVVFDPKSGVVWLGKGSGPR